MNIIPFLTKLSTSLQFRPTQLPSSHDSRSKALPTCQKLATFTLAVLRYDCCVNIKNHVLAISISLSGYCNQQLGALPFRTTLVRSTTNKCNTLVGVHLGTCPKVSLSFEISKPRKTMAPYSLRSFTKTQHRSTWHTSSVC